MIDQAISLVSGAVAEGRIQQMSLRCNPSLHEVGPGPRSACVVLCVDVNHLYELIKRGGFSQY